MNNEPTGKFSLGDIHYEEKSYQESFTAPNAKVLVVDDNEMNLFVIQNLLKKTQIQITTCISGEAAVDLTENNYYDVILLDHMMPGMDGVETFRHIRNTESNRCNKVPVIVLTANALTGSKEEYLEIGFDDYISKPVDGKVLETLLLKHLLIQGVSVQTDKTQENRDITPQDFDNDVVKVEKNLEEVETDELLNVEIGLKYCAGMEEMYVEMLQMFCDLSQEKIHAIHNAFSLTDWKNYIVFVHALKSTALGIGACQLSEVAKKLELAGKAEEIEVIKAEHNNLITLYEKTVGAVKKYLAKGEK